MRKISALILTVLVFSFGTVNFVLCAGSDDIQAIQKAVKENPNYKSGKEAKWFKVLITNNETKKDRVKLTLPLSLVEFFVKACGDEHLRIDGEECDIDLKELFAELKRLGPMALIEVYEDGETIKIWLE